MKANTRIHDLAADLLEYPAPDRLPRIAEAATALAGALPEIHDELAAFAAAVTTRARGALEESYAAAFDNTADRALEVGWHAFGENYSRGAFLVRMRERLRECGVKESGELPDHLSHVLRVLGRIDARQAHLLTEALVMPAVEKMLAATPAADVWRAPIDTARRVLLTHLERAEEAIHA